MILVPANTLVSVYWAVLPTASVRDRVSAMQGGGGGGAYIFI